MTTSLKQALVMAALLAWFAFWALCAWLEWGPCAYIIDLQLRWWGAYYPQYKVGICTVLAFLPFAPGMAFFKRQGWELGRWPFRMLIALLLVGVGGSAFAFYKFWNTPAPERLTTTAEMVSYARLWKRDFLFEDLVREFHLGRAAEMQMVKGSTRQSSIYVPALHESAGPVVLLLSTADWDELMGKTIKGAPVKEKGYTSQPADWLRAHGRGSGFKPNLNALGEKWNVVRKPLPYLVRQKFGGSHNAVWAIQVSPRRGEGADWLLTSIGGVLLFGFVTWVVIKDRKLW